jgi:hypothetical protein
VDYAQLLVVAKSSLMKPEIGVRPLEDRDSSINGIGINIMPPKPIYPKVEERKEEQQQSDDELEGSAEGEAEEEEDKGLLGTAAAAAPASAVGGSDLSKNNSNSKSIEEESKKEEQEGGWQHGRFEVGRRVLVESDRGEEVAIRNIRLDDCDGGAVENILFEEGVRFTHQQEKTQMETRTDISGHHDGREEGEGGEEEGVVGSSLESTLLHPLDQAVILALCLDVSNSNPAVSRGQILLPKYWIVDKYTL